MSLLFNGFWSDIAQDFHRSFIAEQRYLLYFEGIGNTLFISVFALIIGVMIGLLIALIKFVSKFNKGFKIPAKICDVYITIVRGTPVVLQLMIMCFVVFFFLESGVFIAIITFGLNSAAYVAEIARGGLEAVDSGQMEAGRSLGFNMVKTMTYVIIPQAVKKMLPPMGNEFIVLIKETSIVGYVGIIDITRVAYIIQSRTMSAFFSLILSALIYLGLVIVLTYLLKLLEKKLAKSDREGVISVRKKAKKAKSDI